MKGVRFFRTIQMKMSIIYVLLILFAMQLIGVYFMQVMESSSLKSFSNSLEYEASLLATFAAEKLPEGAREGGQTQEEILKAYDDLKDIAKFSSADTLQIVDADGNVVSTTDQNAAAVLGHKNNNILISRALQNTKDNEQTLMDDMGNRIKVLAVPVVKDGKVLGAVYIKKSMKETYATIRRINGIFLSGTIMALALTALLGVFLSHTITSPIKEITRQVTSVAEGRFRQRVRIHGEDEIGQLGKAFNYMTERLQEALSSNEEEKEKLASILSNMSDGVIATDEQNRIILLNHRAAQMLGTDPTQAEGRKLVELVPLPEEWHGEETRDEELRTVMELAAKSEQEPRQVHVTLTPIHRREIGITGAVLVFQDVTEQVEMERSRREFVANVSHELRTPLTTMKSYLEALEDGAINEPELAKRFLDVTRNETERMIRLVTDLLNLSRFDSKQAQIKKIPAAIPEMLEEVADRFSFQFKQKSIRSRLDIGDVRMARIDRDKIDQVLDNLVSNAVKYTPDHGQIVLSCRDRGGEYAEISVADDGIGIPKKDLDHIFERFYRVDKARSRNMGGTGLGLAIAREIVRAHGGSIDLESEYNKGTKVTFTVPYGEGSEPA
ncbi:cell wall metabolism sensor histidine kinase WalK [Gorillibacterium timonense]|uniref:cell wall metabolism sensor histidine kinase WalK n=1 Tax=Gorillibacterium timonense TaxID=1689269 RepID=UPI00071C54BF|nr:cell wall metabolism sensor histidine kinase WalK [Gorillibacterium timonense]